MATDNLLSTLEQTLRQTRAVRARLVSRLSELESESESLRSELRELDQLTSQTEAAMYRLFSGSLRHGADTAGDPLDEQADPLDRLQGNLPGRRYEQERQPAPALRHDIEIKSDRFLERTIPQAASVLLREAGAPLHVNEIYNLLREGGFTFTGHNPTISIAVSLNRNSRFRKVAPGTFDLVMRDAKQAS
jgi:hypothetical protein